MRLSTFLFPSLFLVLSTAAMGETSNRGLRFESDAFGNIFPAERGELRLIVSSPKEITTGTITLRDENDRVLGSVPIAGDKECVVIELPTRGYYQIVASASYRDGTTCREQTSAAVVGPLLQDEQRMTSRFGVDQWVDKLSVAAGIRWRRQGFPHNQKYYTNGRDLQYQVVPESVEAPAEKQTRILCMGEQPHFLQDRKGKPLEKPAEFFPIKDPTAFKRLMRYMILMGQLVLTVDPNHPGCYELLNEPDGWGAAPADLIAFFRLSREAVKAVYPDMKVIGPSPCSIKIDWIDALAREGLFDTIDGLAVHAYVQATPPEEEFIQKVRDLKAYLRKIGKQDVPIYITEYGWTIPPGDWQKPVTPLTQARYVSRSLTLLTAEDIYAICYFMMTCRHCPNSCGSGYALLNADDTPRPSYAAYANATRFLTGAEGPARILQLTPTTYLALFAKKGNTLAVAWTTTGTTSVFLPVPWNVARDMTGRPVAAPADGVLTVSESPTFVELPGRAFYDMRTTSKLSVGRGQSMPLSFRPDWAPAELQISEGRLIAPPTVPAGTYHLIRKTNQGYQAVPVKVVAPLEFISTRLVWPIDAPAPRAEVTLRSNLPKDVVLQATAEWKNDAVGIHAPQVFLAPGQTATIPILLAVLEEGRRYRGRLLVRSTGGGPELSLPLDITWMSCRPTERKPAVIDISAWGPFAGPDNRPQSIPPNNCSAKLRTAYDDRGLHVLVTVRDDAHRQEKTAADMWREDSIQLAFDLDADKPWIANAGGWNGHFKVFEYGLALGPNGPMNWRWISYDEKLPAGQPEKRLVTHVRREGDVTTYRMLFPWAMLGLPGKPPAGTPIGFALVVNDFDGEGTTRNGLRLFDGIVENKDPQSFGRLWLR